MDQCVRMFTENLNKTYREMVLNKPGTLVADISVRDFEIIVNTVNHQIQISNLADPENLDIFWNITQIIKLSILEKISCKEDWKRLRRRQPGNKIAAQYFFAAKFVIEKLLIILRGMEKDLELYREAYSSFH